MKKVTDEKQRHECPLGVPKHHTHYPHNARNCELAQERADKEYERQAKDD